MTGREDLGSELFGVSTDVDRIGLGPAGGWEIATADIADTDGLTRAYIVFVAITVMTTNISTGLNSTPLSALLACYGVSSSTSAFVNSARIKLTGWWE